MVKYLWINSYNYCHFLQKMSVAVYRNNYLMRFFCQLICCFLFIPLIAQNGSEQSWENIVPNASFERYAGVPLGWFYKGKHFTDVMKYWNSPTSASPDIFGPKVRIPKHWAEKGFGEQKARTGVSMVGITMYGCEDGKPHCREYIQIQLKEPMVIGQNYYFEFWVSNLPRSLEANNLGAYFSTKKINSALDKLLDVPPQVRATQITATRGSSWAKIFGRFQATEESDYLIIGNFFSDEATSVKAPLYQPLNYAYYYIDDVLLKKEEPILEVPLKEDDLTKIPLETGKIITLKNIFFETDKYELLPRSFIELNKLLKLMQENPSMIIEVRGHTDIRGTDSYNQYLSRKRAKAVVLFLIENGIDPARTHYTGYGSAKPIANNATAEGMQLNRRVEFKIVSKGLN